MNLHRGLFRIWIVLSIAFVCVSFSLHFDALKQEFQDYGADQVNILEDNLTLEEQQALAIAEAEARLRASENQKYSNVEIEDDKIYQNTRTRIFQAAQQRILNDSHPWLLLLEVSIFSLSIPLFALFVAKCLSWVVQGFKRT